MKFTQEYKSTPAHVIAPPSADVRRLQSLAGLSDWAGSQAHSSLLSIIPLMPITPNTKDFVTG